MKDYESLQKICIDEVKAAGINPGNIVEWTVNRRAKHRWGQCNRRGNTYYINISWRLLEDDKVSEQACKETMVHEILHSCRDGMGHKGRWKQLAAIMNEKYGYNIKRCTSSQEMGLPSAPLKVQKTSNAKPYKCILKCRYCGFSIGFFRNSKMTRYYRNYNCKRCAGKRAYIKYT